MSSAVNFPRLALEKGEWNTLFVPSVPEVVNTEKWIFGFGKHRESLAFFLEVVFPIGKVSWIEYKDTHLPNGEVKKCAWVKFEYWYDTQNVRGIREKIRDTGSRVVGGFYEKDEHTGKDRWQEFFRGESLRLQAAPMDEVAYFELETLKGEIAHLKKKLEVAQSENSAFRAVLKAKVQELATDEMSTETLIWTSQPKLDAHNKRIADIQAILDGAPIEDQQTLAKKVHEQAYEVICAKDEKIASLEAMLEQSGRPMEE